MRRRSPALPRRFALAALLLAIGLPAGAAEAAGGAEVSVANLRAEGLENPLGLDEPRPVLSWQLRSAGRGVEQTAYEVRVRHEGRTVWATGRVASSASTGVPYGGGPLLSSTRYEWQVRVWDGTGRRSRWSEPAWWETGLLAESEWRARWVEPGEEEGAAEDRPSPMLRGEFRVEGVIRRARAYATSLGLYELEINGRRVGDRLFTPGWTSYGKRLAFQTYDVTELLRNGENVVGATLGDGWYRGRLHRAGGVRRNVYGERLALLCQVRVEFEDGRVAVFGTDAGWRWATGAIRSADIYDGETYDGRLEQPAWSAPGFDASGWNPVAVVSPPRRALVATASPPVRKLAEVKPVKVWRSASGAHLVDFGQNLVGFVRVRVRGPAGQEVTLRHGEALDAAGELYTANLRSAAQRVTWILRGGDEEVREPRFTFQGFRYVSVEGWPGEPGPESLTALVVGSDLPATGRFTSSSALLNRLQENIVRSQQGNFLDVPMDCPQRDERLGWTGDTQVFARTAAFNRDVSGFLGKWLADLALEQREDGAVPNIVPNVAGARDPHAWASAGWGDAAVLVPWTLYEAYGDARVLERPYPSMRAWVEYVRRQAGPGLVWRGGDHFGDWLAFSSSAPDDPGTATAKDLVATAYFARSAELLGRAAGLLGKAEDAREYADVATRVREAFVREFVTPAGRVGENTQTAYALALAFDLLPEALRPEAARRLAEDVRRRGHLTTGFLGTPYLCQVLARFGHLDLAYRLLMREEHPSWLYPVTRGATTIWERWDGIRPDGSFQDPGMNSFNHFAYGAIGEFLYRVVAGLDSDEAEPGYRHVVARPRPGGGLTSASARLETRYGEAASGWELAGNRMTVRVTVPPNARGTIVLPGAAGRAVREGGVPVETAVGVRGTRIDAGDFVVEVGSGRYELSWETERSDTKPEVKP
ncbi:MAG TPA: family 78 glycoside hydrolase catalytic domain [Thermoanaerobaculia bacterium]|nr:family 78 glycoside hydrolase catalytic domain [Thermoanaerobaculia bacterium]